MASIKSESHEFPEDLRKKIANNLRSNREDYEKEVSDYMQKVDRRETIANLCLICFGVALIIVAVIWLIFI